MSGSLDTSVLVQLVTGQTPTLAERALNHVAKTKEQLAIADAAIIELILVLERVKKMSRSNIGIAIDMLAGQKVFNFNRVLFARALLLYKDHPALSIQDCCLATYAELNDARPLWTFDQKLGKQAPGVKLI